MYNVIILHSQETNCPCLKRGAKTILITTAPTYRLN